MICCFVSFKISFILQFTEKTEKANWEHLRDIMLIIEMVISGEVKQPVKWNRSNSHFEMLYLRFASKQRRPWPIPDSSTAEKLQR